MTPQERQLVDDLFERLARLEATPRDPEAAAAITQGLRIAPNAIYGLVQTVLVQDEALKRAHERIQELEADHAPQSQERGGFLDSMRDAFFGQGQTPQRGSVPNVPPPPPAAARPGTPGRCSASNPPRRLTASRRRRPMGSHRASMAARSAARAAQLSVAAEVVVVRSSAPRRQPPPVWSVARCYSPASAA